jgi:hypothetical protein
MPIPFTGFIVNRVTRVVCMAMGKSEREARRLGFEVGLKTSVALMDPLGFKATLAEAAAVGLDFWDIVGSDSDIRKAASILDTDQDSLRQLAEADPEIQEAMAIGFEQEDTQEYFKGKARELPLTKEAQLRFSGGFSGIEDIADYQVGPTCGFEALENIIQLFYPNVGNDLSDQLINSEMQLGYNPDHGLSPLRYSAILEPWGISAHWYPFDQQGIAQAINHHHAVAVVGDPYYLGETEIYRRPGGLPHIWVLTGTVYDEVTGRLIAYEGIDSNISGEVRRWSVKAVYEAVKHKPPFYRYPVMVTDQMSPHF